VTMADTEPGARSPGSPRGLGRTVVGGVSFGRYRDTKLIPPIIHSRAKSCSHYEPAAVSGNAVPRPPLPLSWRLTGTNTRPDSVRDQSVNDTLTTPNAIGGGRQMAVVGRPRFDGHLDSKDGTTESRCER
jgi:hypothetical protein